MIDTATMNKLKAPFPATAIDVKPGATSEKNGQRSGLVLTFIDARAVQDRLDDAFDGQWDFTWEPMPEYRDKLAVKGIIRAAGIERQDVGQANGEEEPYKSAVSDAMKRAAVHFGIGRYLYSLPTVWWPMEGKYFIEHDQLVNLMGDLAQELADAGGDLTKIDMRRYRYGVGQKVNPKPKAPAKISPEQIEELKAARSPFASTQAMGEWFKSIIGRYPRNLWELTEQEGEKLIGAMTELPDPMRQAA